MLEKLEDIRRKYDAIRARLADPEFVQDHRAVRDAQKTLAEFEPVVAKIEELRRVQKELGGARELTESLPAGRAGAEGPPAAQGPQRFPQRLPRDPGRHGGRRGGAVRLRAVPHVLPL